MGKEGNVGIKIKYKRLVKKNIIEKILIFLLYFDKKKPKKPASFFLSEKLIQAYVIKKFFLKKN